MLSTEQAMHEARKALCDHPMCAKLIEEADRILVMFPPGYTADAAQMRYRAEGVSKTRAFELLLATCEKYWNIL